MIDAETENVSSETMHLVWNIVMKQYDQRDAGLLKFINLCYSS